MRKSMNEVNWRKLEQENADLSWQVVGLEGAVHALAAIAMDHGDVNFAVDQLLTAASHAYAEDVLAPLAAAAVVVFSWPEELGPTLDGREADVGTSKQAPEVEVIAAVRAALNTAHLSRPHEAVFTLGPEGPLPAPTHGRQRRRIPDCHQENNLSREEMVKLGSRGDEEPQLRRRTPRA
jgi:hypothetical protein